MIYAATINKFIVFNDLSCWGNNGIGIFIIDEKNECEEEYVCFESHKIKYNDDGTQEMVDFSSHRVDKAVDFYKEKSKQSFCCVDEDTIYFFDEEEKIFFLKINEEIYEYKF